MQQHVYRFNVGAFSCLVIRDGDDGARDPLFVATGQHQVLIDTGVGNGVSPENGRLLDRLNAAGISPIDIDFVIFSHADWDHIAGAIDQDGKPSFPNARYVLTQPEWDFWTANPERVDANLVPDEEFRNMAVQIPQRCLAQIRDQVQLVEFGAEIVPGVRALDAAGHTPGHTLIAITSGGERLTFTGDLFYTPQDVANPDIASIYDFDPIQSVRTRRRFYAQAAREGLLLKGFHMDFPGLGHIVADGPGWRWQPLSGTQTGEVA